MTQENLGHTEKSARDLEHSNIVAKPVRLVRAGWSVVQHYARIQHGMETLKNRQIQGSKPEI
jgi:hypothetical protein